jgi:hypothetical protein
MNCCNDYGQCTQSHNCAVRSCQDWQYPPRAKDKSPQSELVSDLFYLVGFVLLVAVISLIAGVGWGVFEMAYPSTACMVRTLISISCK